MQAVVDIETAIRAINWYTPQVGRKSLQRVIVDFSAGRATSTFTTGITHLGLIELKSVNDSFTLPAQRFGSNFATFTVVGRTGTKVGLPSIDYRFDITVNLQPQLVSVTGAHDGYPSYGIKVGRTAVYDFQQTQLWKLGGGLDVNAVVASASWR